MKFFSHTLKFALAGAIILGVLGCQESNESVVDEQARKTAGADVNVGPPPKNQQEFGQRSQQNNPLSKGYSGAKAAAKAAAAK